MICCITYNRMNFCITQTSCLLCNRTCSSCRSMQGGGFTKVYCHSRLDKDVSWKLGLGTGRTLGRSIGTSTSRTTVIFDCVQSWTGLDCTGHRAHGAGLTSLEWLRHWLYVTGLHTWCFVEMNTANGVILTVGSRTCNVVLCYLWSVTEFRAGPFLSEPKTRSCGWTESNPSEPGQILVYTRWQKSPLKIS